MHENMVRLLTTATLSIRRIIDHVGMRRLRAQHGKRSSGGGYGSRTASRRRQERMAQVVKTATATMKIRRMIELVGSSRLCVQHGEHVTAVAMRGTASRRGHERAAQVVKTTTTTMTIHRYIDLVGMSCLRAQHGEHAGGGHGRCTASRRTHCVAQAREGHQGQDEGNTSILST